LISFERPEWLAPAIATRRTDGGIPADFDPALEGFQRRCFSQTTDDRPNYYRAINNAYNDFALVARKVELFLFMQVIRESA
jgi:hypothetical protein